MKNKKLCPLLTVDIIIECNTGIVLIQRKYPPLGWAIPGGFVDYGECIEDAAVREALEETCLNITLIEQMHTYSNPARDPRSHTVSTVFIATADGEPRGADDARQAAVFTQDTLPGPIVFDHAEILNDYFAYAGGAQQRHVFGYNQR
ncbi:MAG: NUDIX hydrolase [Desulfobacteraceae bacterium]|nr:NUDIX hydrolase [Desulfobacteraceae bacterium]